MVDFETPEELQSISGVQHQEHDAVDGQCRHVDCRRITHAAFQPDLGRQSVTREADNQPNDQQNSSEHECFRYESLVKAGTRITFVDRLK